VAIESVLTAVVAALVIALIATIAAWALNILAKQLPADEQSLIERVNALLPQTQCAQCNYPGCRPYAEAIVNNSADINQCPPGGDEGIKALAQLLGRDIKPLDNSLTSHKPPQIAIIREQDCIGCTLCIAACPVDAIIGASRKMHTVITASCTGCELCLPPCPVDCIDLLKTNTELSASTSATNATNASQCSADKTGFQS